MCIRMWVMGAGADPAIHCTFCLFQKSTEAHTWLMEAVPFLIETLKHYSWDSPVFSLPLLRSHMHFVWYSVSSQLFASKPISSFPSEKKYKTIIRSPCIAGKKLNNLCMHSRILAFKLCCYLILAIPFSLHN